MKVIQNNYKNTQRDTYQLPGRRGLCNKWNSDFIGVKMDENAIEMMQIKEIQLNPRFCSQEMFNDIEIKNRGIKVSWLEETELEKDIMVEIIIPDDTR